MEQVAAVLDALSDAKETTRQQVIGLVERITLRLEKVESKNQQLVRENESLRDQLNMVPILFTIHIINYFIDRTVEDALCRNYIHHKQYFFLFSHT